jgi:HSP20 family protein
MLSTMFANDVRQTLENFRRSVEQSFENAHGYQNQPGGSRSSADQSYAFSPALESGWNDNFLHLRAILPGVSEKDVNVTVQNNQLVIEGERKAPETLAKSAYTHLAYGKFYAAVMLPTGVDADKVNCRLSNGILEIQLPIAEASKPRTIQVRTGTEQSKLGA